MPDWRTCLEPWRILPIPHHKGRTKRGECRGGSAESASPFPARWHGFRSWVIGDAFRYRYAGAFCDAAILSPIRQSDLILGQRRLRRLRAGEILRLRLLYLLVKP